MPLAMTRPFGRANRQGFHRQGSEIPDEKLVFVLSEDHRASRAGHEQRSDARMWSVRWTAAARVRTH